MNRFETSNFIMGNINKEYSLFEKGKDQEAYYLKALIFRQANRIVYRTTLTFWDIKTFCKHTPKDKPQDDNEAMNSLFTLKNRYLDPKHSKEIEDYIVNEINSFILPNMTAVVNKPFDIVFEKSDEDAIEKNISNLLEEHNGNIFAYLKIPKGTKVEVTDGNHRVAAIINLINNGKINVEKKGLYIGIDFYVESVTDNVGQLFVLLNSNKPIDSSVVAALSARELITDAAKKLMGYGDNYKYIVDAFIPESDNYIGVELTKDIVKTGEKVITFNIIKNIISLITFNTLNADSKFQSTYCKDKAGYEDVLEKIALYLNLVFKKCEPFTLIRKGFDYDIKKLKSEYINLSGAGLYVIGAIGHRFIKYKEINIEALTDALAQIDWRKTIEADKNQSIFNQETKEFEMIKVKSLEMNPLFLDGILNTEGKISNNRGVIKATEEKILEYLNITDEKIEEILKTNEK